MSESICFKCKWHQGDHGYGECSWTKENPHPDAFLCGTSKSIVILREVYDCPTFEPREENSCLNCRHADWDDHDCVWMKYSDLPIAFSDNLESTSIRKDRPYTNCPTWEAK